MTCSLTENQTCCFNFSINVECRLFSVIERLACDLFVSLSLYYVCPLSILFRNKVVPGYRNVLIESICLHRAEVGIYKRDFDPEKK